MRQIAFKIGISPVDFEAMNLSDFGDCLIAFNTKHGLKKPPTVEEVKQEHEEIMQELGEWQPPNGGKIINGHIC